MSYGKSGMEKVKLLAVKRKGHRRSTEAGVWIVSSKIDKNGWERVSESLSYTTKRMLLTFILWKNLMTSARQKDNTPKAYTTYVDSHVEQRFRLVRRDEPRDQDLGQHLALDDDLP